jgi:P pilus assembly chaperone PapD
MRRNFLREEIRKTPCKALTEPSDSVITSLLSRVVSPFVLVCALVLPSAALAQVTVNTVIVTFLARQRPIQNVLVGNSSDHPAYVQARLEKVLNPGEGGDKSEPSNDLLISPKTFSIEPNGQRAVRFLLRKVAKDTEGVYRVLFTPQDRGFGQEVKQSVGGRTASIRVLTGMGVLVFVEPKNPVGHLKWTRTKKGVTFQNDGNIHVELGEGKLCYEEKCEVAPRKRVYAGDTFEVAVAGQNNIQYLVRTGSSGVFEALSIPPLEDDELEGEIKPAAFRK